MTPRSLLLVALTLVVAVPATVLLTRVTTADDRGIILNWDPDGAKHVKQYISLLRRSAMLTASDTTGGALYVMLDKSDLMKAFDEHNTNTPRRDSIVGFIVHFGFYGDTLQPAK